MKRESAVDVFDLSAAAIKLARWLPSPPPAGLFRALFFKKIQTRRESNQLIHDSEVSASRWPGPRL